MVKERDDFNKKTIENLAKRASYICSNPDCRNQTLSPSENDPEKYINIGKAAHITAAAENGPRYDSSLTPEQRSSIDNGIFLCSNCADMVDKNLGLDFSVELLKKWKEDHEKWIRENLNKSVDKQRNSIKRDRYQKEMDLLVALLCSNIGDGDIITPKRHNPNSIFHEKREKFLKKINQNKYLAVTEDLRLAIENYLEYLEKPEGLFKDVRDELQKASELRYLELQKLLK